MAISGSGVKKDALSNYGTNAATAASDLSTVNPIYSRLATGTVGYTPQQTSDMTTASSQAIGGATAGAVGQGGLYAARTGNAGGATAAIDDAARAGGTENAANDLNVQNQSAQLAEQNQRVGLNGLNGIYADANGQAANSLDIANRAKPTFWQGVAGTAANAAAGRIFG